MRILNDLVPGAAVHTGAVLVYVDQGCIHSGLVLRDDEFVTSIAALEETRRLAGLEPSSFRRSKTDL